MLNIFPGMYIDRDGTSLPLPLIKEIIILPSEMEDLEQKQKTLNLQLKIVLQRIRNKDTGPFNLHVSAITNKLAMRVLKSDKERNGVRSLINQSIQTNQPSAKNIGMKYDKNNMSPFVYNPNATPVFNQTVLVPLTVKFDDKLDYLSVVVATSESGGEGKRGRSDKGSKLKVSRPAIETVLESGRPPRYTNVFQLSSTKPNSAGPVWAGPVHRRSSKELMAGAYHSTNPHPTLTSTKVPNFKIKDYRVLSINSFFQTDKVAPPSSPAARSRSMLKKSKKEKKNAYLSELSFSRSADNIVKIFFSFDLGQFMEHNSDLSYLFKSPRSLLSTTRIEGIKIYREPISIENVGNRLTQAGGAPPVNNCTLNQRTEVASLSAKTVRVLHAAQSTTSNIYEILALDQGMGDLTPGGSYAYSVEFEILDNSSSAIKEMTSSLRAKMSDFEGYLLKFFNYNKKKYDPETYIASFLTNESGSERWKSLLIEYVSSLVFLRGPQIGEFDVTSILKNFMAMADPSSASAQSLLTFRDAINQYILQLEKVVGLASVAGSTAPQSYQSKLSNSSPRKRRMHFRPQTQQLYFNDARANTGFDYVGPQLRDLPHDLGTITPQQFINRALNELEKYQVPNPSDPTINKFGFLSPDSVITPTGDIKSQRNMSFTQSLDLLHANMAPLSKHRSFIGNPSLLDRRNAQIEGILHTVGASYERKNIKLRDMISEVTPAAQSVVDVTEYVPATSEFAVNYNAVEALEGDPTPRHRAVIRGANNQIGEVPLVEALISEAAQGFKPATPVNVYEIDGSLAAAELRNPNRRAASFPRMNVLEKNINFNSLVKVEYLVGYKKGVKDPSWRSLDRSVLNRIEKNGGSVLCRLSPPGRSLNIKNRFKLPNYNALFVVGEGTLAARNLKPQFKELLASLKEELNRTILGRVLNAKAAGDRVLTEYTCSDEIIYVLPARKRRTSTRGTPQKGSLRSAPSRMRGNKGNY